MMILFVTLCYLLSNPLTAGAKKRDARNPRENVQKQTAPKENKVQDAKQTENESEDEDLSSKNAATGGNETSDNNINEKKTTEEKARDDNDFKEEDFKPKAEEESYAWMVIKTILVLGILVGGFYYFFRFVSKKTGIVSVGGEAARVLSVIPLGQNKSLQIVECAGRVLVLGVTDGNINLLTEIIEKDAIDRLRIQSSKEVTASANNFQDFVFAQIGKAADSLERFKNRGKSGQPVSKSAQNREEFSEESGVDISYLREQRRRLAGLNGNEGKESKEDE
jgi:flagellar biosynthetic protein FliO